MTAASPLAGLVMDRPLRIVDILRHAADAYPDGQALSRPEADEDGTLPADDAPLLRRSWAEVLERACRLAHALTGLGIRPGDRVATLAWNTLPHLELYYAVTGIGAVLLTLNPRLPAAQLGYILDRARPRAVFVSPDLAPTLAPLLEGAPDLRQILLARSYEALIAAQSAAAYSWPEFDERSAATLLYTSATTGRPKGVLTSQRSVVLHAMGLLACHRLPYAPGTRVLPIVPMFHVLAWGQPFVAPMAGCSLLLPGPAPRPAHLHRLIEREGADIAMAVPTVWLGLADFMDRNGHRKSSLAHMVTGGAAIAAALVRRWQGFGCRVHQGWGMTETGPVCAFSEVAGAGDEAALIGQRRVFGAELRLDSSLGAEGSGELQCRGPWIASAYWGDDEASAEGFTADGWLRTGDIARLDGAVMTVVDRAKDLIKSGGEWIGSVALEDAASSHPLVAQAAAIAVPDPQWGERPLLAVVPARELAAAEEAEAAASIRALMARTLPRWWLPEQVRFLDAMPLAATGKISKLALRQRFAAPAESTPGEGAT